MANKVIILDAFARASFPHLDQPFAHDPKDAEKFRLQLMFTKDGVYNHPEVGDIESHPYEIIDALDEVCQDTFNYGVREIEDVTALKEEVGVMFPPSFKDGDKVKMKDENGRPMPGKFDPKTAGYWMLNLTSNEQPGCIGPDENEIDPKTIYSGCWVRVQIEVSAYYNKQNNAPIVNLDLMNVQYCYDDESLGGRTPRQDAKTAFSGRKIANSNVKAGTGARMGRPEAASERPSRPGRPAVGKPQMKPELELVATQQWSIEELRGEGFEMTDEEIVSEGYGEWQEVETKPSRPNRPAASGRPNRPAVNETTERKAPPTKKLPPKRKPSGPKVVMFEDSEYTYDELKNDHGWTDDDIVTNGYGEFDYTNPDD